MTGPVFCMTLIQLIIMRAKQTHQSLKCARIKERNLEQIMSIFFKYYVIFKGITSHFGNHAYSLLNKNINATLVSVH